MGWSGGLYRSLNHTITESPRGLGPTTWELRGRFRQKAGGGAWSLERVLTPATERHTRSSRTRPGQHVMTSVAPAHVSTAQCNTHLFKSKSPRALPAPRYLVLYATLRATAALVRRAHARAVYNPLRIFSPQRLWCRGSAGGGPKGVSTHRQVESVDLPMRLAPHGVPIV